MHRQVEILGSGSWFWPALIIFLLLLVIGFIIYMVGRNRKNKGSVTKILEEEQEMAVIYCPNLLSEVMQLRAEVKRLKGISGRKDVFTGAETPISS
jgi:uncharacterized integral membrane protein